MSSSLGSGAGGGVCSSNAWSMTFQSYANLTMLKAHTKKSDQSVMMERSLYSANYCFTANLKESGNMTESEYQVLSNWFQYFLDCKEVDLSVDVILYLHVKAKFPITIIHVLLSD